MQVTFQQQLNAELLKSEKRRTLIVICMFSFAMVYRFIDTYFFKADAITKEIQSIAAAWLFPMSIVLFEVLSLLYIIKRLKTNRDRIPAFLKFLNAGLEISLPTVIITALARQYPAYDVVTSPAMYIYFIFIILSTLRLNFTLSLFSGLLSAASYFIFSFILSNHFDANDAMRSMVLILSGVAAGLVANQIQAGIKNSLREAEKRHRVENMFGQQLSPEVAEKMLENDGMMESRRMNVAVMFIDIRNFTNFAVGRTPEEIVQYQNSFFTIVINIVSKYDGIVNQFLGDGCMVTFGAPLPLDNPSQKAVNAACELVRQLEASVHESQLVPTRIGIGIHTGEAVTGNIGTTTRQQYSITGRVVIMASRIEQLNKQFHSQVLVSEDVIRNIDSTRIGTEHYTGISLKGFEEPITIYKVA